MNHRHAIQQQLARAIRSNDFFEVLYLLKVCQADPGCEHSSDNVQDEPVDIAGSAGLYCQSPHIWDLLFEHGLNPTSTLREAMEWGNVTLAMACVLRGADINMLSADGKTKFFERFIRLLAYEEQHGTLIEGLTLFGRRIIAGMIYAAGYKDETGKVRELLRSSKHLREILDIEKSDDILDQVQQIYEMRCREFFKANPYKNPDNYTKLLRGYLKGKRAKRK